VVLPPIAQALIDRAGWRIACALLGGMVLVVGLPGVFAFVRERPSAAPATTHEGATVREGLASRAFWILIVVLFGSSIAQNGAITHLSAMLTDRGVGAAGAAMALSAMGGRRPRWPPADRVAPRPLLRRARLVRAALGGGLRHVAPVLGEHAAGGCARRRARRVRDGWRRRRDAVLAVALLRLRSFSTLYGLTWTAYAIGRGDRTDPHGHAFDVSGYHTRHCCFGCAIATLVVAGLMPFCPATRRRKLPTAPTLGNRS
jgi:hypothetical protein